MKLKAIIIKDTDGTYDVNLEYSEKVSFGLFGSGNTVEESKADYYNSHNEMQAYCIDLVRKFPENLYFEFKYDVASFLK